MLIRLKSKVGNKLDEYLWANYPTTPPEVMERETGLTIKQLYARAHSIGVKRSPEYLLAITRTLAKTLAEKGKAHRFTKGQVPPNKGQKMPAEVYQKAKATMFKPGRKPHNTKHDGHISIRRDKTGRDYAWVRVREGEYRLLHRVVWEQNNGPIPNNMVVAFKSTNTMDCTLENLELITKEDNMRRNSIFRYPPELVGAIRTNASLKRRIRKLEERW